MSGISEKYKGKDIYQLEMDQLRYKYKKWKGSRKDSHSTFFMIYSDFKDIHLKDISGGALKLYVYLGFQADTFTGECWQSIDSIAYFFRNDTRTVNKWVKELEERGLIKRIQTGFKRISNTFLIPYGDQSESDD